METAFEPAGMPAIEERIGSRIDLSGSAVSLAWSGLRAMTPDRRAMVGPIPGIEGAWCALGFSGHGFMHAPAIGLAIAEMMNDRKALTFDLTELDPARWLEPSEPPGLLIASHH